MGTFFDLCLRRQSCRKYTGKPVEHEKLEACIEAARQTPSACNSQPWSFVVMESPELVAEAAQCAQSFGNNAWAGEAGAFVLVLEEYAPIMPKIRQVFDSQMYAHSDIGAAIYGITLAAAEQGLGSCIIGTFDRPRLAELLGLPLEKRQLMLIALGYAEEDKIRPKQRKPLEDIVRYV